MDTSGNIRPLSEGDPLREGEVEINDEERRSLEHVPPSRRRQRLDDLRAEQRTIREHELEAERLRQSRIDYDRRRNRRHERSVAWPAAHKARQAKKAKA